MPHLKINKLSLFDFRCFKELVIDFHPDLTVLVAGNGAGKTSVLDAIAVALGPFVGGFDEAVGKGFAASDIREYPTRKPCGAYAVAQRGQKGIGGRSP